MRNLSPASTRWPEGSLGGESERLKSRFARAGIENAATDAAVLLCWVACCDRSRLAAHPEELLSREALDKLSGAAHRREGREPLAYIVGEREFWSLSFETGPAVLIPRPETELLVERALSLLAGAKAPRILDLCTGSGVVGVALAKEISGAHLVATDLSETALELAAKNARRNGVGDRFESIHSDLFEKIPGDGTFDAVVSNPPYVPSGEIESLMPEVSRFEPRGALDGGPGGTDFLWRIVREAPTRLKKGGVLLLEMDPGQIAECVREIRLAGVWDEPVASRDLAGRERVLEARKV